MTPATLTVVPSSQTIAYGATPAPIVAHYYGFVNGDTAPCRAPSCSSQARATSPAGYYTARCVNGSDPRYSFSYSTGYVEITRAAQTITVTPAAPRTVGFGQRFEVADTTSAPGLTVSYTVAGTACTLRDRGDGSAVVTAVALGSCQVDARQNGDSRYAAAPRVTATVSVVKAAQVVAFTSAPPVPATVGTTFTATATGGGSGNPVVVTSLTTAVCTVGTGDDGTTAVTLVHAGTCRLAADQAGGVNHRPRHPGAAGLHRDGPSLTPVTTPGGGAAPRRAAPSPVPGPGPAPVRAARRRPT